MLNANFTMCFKDVYEQYPTVLDDIQMSTDSRTELLVEMLKSRFDIYEIAGETISEFKLFITNKFKSYVKYYEEMLDAYEEEFDWKLGNVDTLNLADTDGNTRTVTPASVRYAYTEPRTDSTSEDYDLPRQATSENRPSSKTVSRDSEVRVETGYVSGNDTIVDTGGKTHTGTRSNVNLVEQRTKFMSSVRNLYSEFADKFTPCFLQIYAQEENNERQ